jgi:dihydroxy-acid dehydratase
MEAGKTPDGRTVDLIDVFNAAAAKQGGKLSAADLLTVEQAGCPTCGSCSGMFTANSMNCLCEALGLALPTNGTLLATSADRKILFRRAAKRVVEMVWELEKKGEGHGLLPREIVTHDSIDNSMILDMAMGGSTNTVLHILAIAREAGIEYDMERINSLSRRTPNICKVSPSSKYHVQDVHNAGGVHTILGAVNRGRPGLLKLDCPTVTGQTLGDNIAAYDIRAKTATKEALELAAVTAGGAHSSQGMSVPRHAQSIRDLAPADLGFDPADCIREVENAYSQEGGLAILYGNLAPKGAVVKAAGVRPEMLKHSGPAVIFEAETEAYEGIVGGKVKAGDVVVIRYEGPRGGPGMQEMLAPTTAIKGMRLDDKVALVTDGHQGYAIGRQGGTGDRWPLLRRHGRRLHWSHQSRGGRRRSHRAIADRRHHRHRHPGPLTGGPAQRGRVDPAGQTVETPPTTLQDRLPRQVHRPGHQRRHGRRTQVGLKTRSTAAPGCAESPRTAEGGCPTNGYWYRL